MKTNHVKKDQGEKLIQTLIFSKLRSCSWGFKKKECSAYYRILFTPKIITNQLLHKPLQEVAKNVFSCEKAYKDFLMLLTDNILH